MSTSIFGLPTTVAMTLLALASTLGLILLIRGLRGRREGGDLHCRRCGYNLTGLISPRCPECGTTLTARTVTRGRLHRRPVPLALSLLLLAAALAGWGTLAYRKVVSTNWYPHYPLSWVLGGAVKGDRRALEELLARTKEDRLGNKVSPVIDAALARQGLRRGTFLFSSHNNWYRILAHAYTSRQMTTAQTEEYLTQLISLRLSVRETVCAGDPIPIAFKVQECGGPVLELSNQFQVLVRDESVFIDGVRGDGHRRPVGAPLGGDDGRIRLYDSTGVAAGVHRVEAVATLVVQEKVPGKLPGEVVFMRQYREEATFRLLDSDEECPIESVSAPGYEASLDSILDSRFGVAATLLVEAPPEIRIQGSIQVEGVLSTPLAFSAVLYQGDHQISPPESQVRLVSGPPFVYCGTYIVTNLTRDTPLFLELQSDRTAAAENLDVYRYWDGVYRLGPLNIVSYLIQTQKGARQVGANCFFNELEQSLGVNPADD
ncbi:MAG: hypothetical protein FLDDKLPJ_01143 [Phycisphaerae bacterium]|nr:hypothetical protein [Phycisphaerae bacterium]